MAAVIEDAKLKFVESADDCAEFMRWLGERHEGDVIAFDSETMGLRWWEPNFLRLVQFGDTHVGWSIPWHDWGGLVREAFRKYDGWLVGHNVSFDVKALANGGIVLPWHHLRDTMTAAHLEDPLGSQALKDLSTRLVDRTAAAGQRALSKAMAEQGWKWDTVPVDFPPYWGYAALDCVLTAHLELHYRPLVTGEGRLARAYDLEMAARKVCTEMEVRGARIDVPYCERKKEELETYAAEVARWCRQNYGVEPTSPQQVVGALLRDGVELTKRTDKGSFSTDKDVLEALEPDPVADAQPAEGEAWDAYEDRIRRTRHPLAAQVLAVRKAKKLASSYFSNLVTLADGDRVHPSIRTHAALTGRMSVTEPALQTLPRGRVVRDAFIPEEGHGIVCVDYSNVELRLAASFSREPAMIDAFLNNRDLHTETARGVFALGDRDPDPRQRQIAKAVNFTLWYGGGVDAIAAQAKIPVDEARGVLERYYAAFTRVKQFQRETEAEGRRNLALAGYPFLEDASTGRRWPTDEDKVYTLVNYKIQGTAAIEFKRALTRLDAAGLAQYAVVPVHDEVVFSLPEEAIADGIVREIEEAMELRDVYAVPLAVESSGPYPRWGEKYAA